MGNLKILPVVDIHYNVMGELTFSLFPAVDKKHGKEMMSKAKGMHALWESLTGPERVIFAKRSFIHHHNSADDKETRLFAPFMVSEGETLYRPVYERLNGRWRLCRLPATFLRKSDEGDYLFQCPSLSPLAETLN